MISLFGLGFTMNPYVHFVHLLPPSVMCNYMSSRFDLVMPKKIQNATRSYVIYIYI